MTAEELLADGEVYEYSNVLVIDAETREINIPLGEEFFGVEGDVKVERKYFSCPKVVGDNIDLSECNIYINYVLADKEGNPKSEDVESYFCDDLSDDGDNIKFTWVLSERVLAEDGYVAFAVVAKKSVNGVLENKWNTTPGIGIVKKTIKDGEEIQQKYPDVIDNLMNRVHELESIIESGGVGGGSVTSVNGQTGDVNINVPSKTSDLENDKGYITRLVADLENYYLKSETYTQDEVKALVSAIPKFSIQPVDSLPTTNISATTVYLLKSGNETDNLYTEYIYVNGAWEYLGKQTVDLSGYAKKATTLSGYGITDAATKEEVQRLSKEIVDLKTQGNQSSVLNAQGETVEEALAWLAENGDTTKVYLLPNGNQAIYTTVEVVGGIQELTEQIIGEFTENKRLSTSSGNLSDLSGAITTPLIDLTPYGKQKVIIRLYAVNGGSDSSVKWGANTAVTGNSSVLFNNGTFLWGGYTGYTTHAGVTYEFTNVSDVKVIIDLSVMSCTHARFSGVTGVTNRVAVSVTYKKETQGGTESKWVDTGRGLISSDYDERLIALEADNTNLKARVKSLEDSAMFDKGIPDYVLTEAEEVADKVLAVRDADSLVAGFVADLHTNGTDASSVGVLHAGQALDVVNSITPIDLIGLLGDYEVYDFSYGNSDTDGEDARVSHKFVNKAFSSVEKSVPTIKIKGNHDYGSASDSEQKAFAYIGANNKETVIDYANKSKIYGYRDFENHKIRVIYLNTADGGSCNVSAEQLNWLNTVALNLTDSEWGIIVLSHHPLNWDGMSGVLNALNAYKGKGTDAELIAHIHGHLHNFRVETMGTNGVLSITIPNACFGRNNEYGTSSSYSDTIHANFGDTDENGNQRQFNKTSGTANDTALNVLVVKRQNRKIHCFNYGTGIDRELSY